jgi:hypothetical protein
VGPSTATAPPIVILRVLCCAITAMNDAVTARNATVSWITCRNRRGVNTSSRMPTHAAPKRISIGSSAP